MRSALIHSLPDEVINKTVMQFGDTPIGCSKAISPYISQRGLVNVHGVMLYSLDI